MPKSLARRVVLGGLLVLGAFDSLYFMHDGDGVSEAPRRLRQQDADEFRSEMTLDGKEQTGSSLANLTEKFHEKWLQNCGSIIESHTDTVSYEEGKRCWETCGNLIAVRKADSWVAHWQASLQASALSQFLFTHTPMPAPAVLCLLIIVSGTGSAALVDVLMEATKYEAANGIKLLVVLFIVVVLLSRLAICGWLMFVACFVISITSDANPEDASLIMGEQAWIQVWSEALSWVMPVAEYFHPLIFVMLLAVNVLIWSPELKFQTGDELVVRMKEFGIAWLRVDFSALAVGWIGYLVFSWAVYLFRVGHHGVAWSCSKATSAATFGWLPPQAPYWAAAVYVIASVIHGLLNSPEIIKPSQAPDADTKFFSIVSETWYELAMLLSTGAGLLLDIFSDMAQTLMFIFRGQPFFGFSNLLGILMQMLMLVVAMAEGSTTEVSLLSSALQSDVILSLRSSFAAGMQVLALHEKAFREAFGETYLSMSISIFAIFSMHFKYFSDIMLMVFSVCFSLNSMRKGVGEARELVAAEQEQAFDNCDTHFQVLPLNHYHFRARYMTDRSKVVVQVYRMAESIVPIVTLAVCVASGSARAAYLAAACISFLTFMARFLWKEGASVYAFLLSDILGAISDFWKEGDYTSAFGVVATVIILILPWWVVWLVFIGTTPLLTSQLLVLWNRPLTIPQEGGAQPFTDSLTAWSDEAGPERLLAVPIEIIRAMLSNHRCNFSTSVIDKLAFVSMLWVSMLVSTVFLDGAVFDVRAVWHDATEALSSQSRKLKLLAYLRVTFMLISIIGIFVLGIAGFLIHGRRQTWSTELAKAVQACNDDFEMARNAVRTATEGLLERKLLTKEVPDRDDLGSEARVGQSVFAHKLLGMIMGDPNRYVSFVSYVDIADLLNEQCTPMPKSDGLQDAERPQDAFCCKRSEGVVWELCVGGALSFKGPGARELFGTPLPEKVAIRALKQLATLGPSAELAFTCKAWQAPGTEGWLHQSLGNESSNVSSASALAKQTGRVSSEIGEVVASFRRLEACKPEHLKVLKDVEASLSGITRCLQNLCLFIKMPGSSGLAQSSKDAFVPLRQEDGEEEDGIAQAFAQAGPVKSMEEFVEDLHAAMGKLPSRSEMILAKAEEHRGEGTHDEDM